MGNGSRHSDCCRNATQCFFLVDVISYSSAIIACEKGLKWTHAFGLLVRMQHHALLSAVIRGARKGCQGKGGCGNGKAFFFAQREEGERPKEAPLWVSENPLFS